MTEIREVAFGSPEHASTIELRREVLRRPLGLDFSAEQLAGEEDQIHLALLHGDEALACLILVAHRDGEAKMRQVAVRPDLQGQGIGRQLVEASEAFAIRRGLTRMVLHARETAVPFYERLGYAVEGEPFEEVGIPHRRMSKRLS